MAHLESLPYSEKAYQINKTIERSLNHAIRGYDKIARPLGLGVRRSNYDDLNYCFEGGVGDKLRQKHYDKSLRLLWKAQQHVPFSTFKDCTKDEMLMLQMAEDSMNSAEKKELKRIRSDEYRELLNKYYTPEQKQSIVNILVGIGHGEAYAWIISTQLMEFAKSTGGRAALTMQVVEEAKHFVVLREIIYAFDCHVPGLLSWEYILLENVIKQKGLEKFFGMNVLVEGIALSIFGLFSTFPGLEFLKMFHLDESRHTGLPHAYFSEFPMTKWQKYNPASMYDRTKMLLPVIPFLFRLEKDLAVVGIDAFDFAGSILRKVTHLSERVGFVLPVPIDMVRKQFNLAFNGYCYLTRDGHTFKNFMLSETTTGLEELQAENEAFQLGQWDPEAEAMPDLAAVA